MVRCTPADGQDGRGWGCYAYGGVLVGRFPQKEYSTEEGGGRERGAGDTAPTGIKPCGSHGVSGTIFAVGRAGACPPPPTSPCARREASVVIAAYPKPANGKRWW